MLRMACKQMKTALNFSRYDFIGFDLDNTLCSYNLKNVFNNHYCYLAAYLNRTERYNIPTKITPALVDYISRGLIIDIENGNLLKVTADGEIVRACHGTKVLSMEEIARKYELRRWNLLDEIISTNFQTWMSKSKLVYSFMDFTDAAFTAIYALAIESGVEAKTVFADVIKGVETMYSDKEWINDIILTNHQLYINKTPEKVIKWIQELKETKKIGLITSNTEELVAFIASKSLGSDWKLLFDFIIYDAKKPGFFSNEVPFYDLDGTETTFNLLGSYTRGCIRTIQSTLAKELNKEPLCMYIGDSPFHDFMFTEIDYIAIVEELAAEKNSHQSSEFISSSLWGSYLYEGDKPTLFGKFALNSKFCVPDLVYFANHPIDYEFDHSIIDEPPK